MISLDDFIEDEFTEREWRFLTIFSGKNPRTGEAKPFDLSNIPWMNASEWDVLQTVKEFYDSLTPAVDYLG